MDMKWIPTSEKLPEALGNYLVTANIKAKTDPDFNYTFVMIDHYNGCGRWTENNSRVRKVIAWMNIPDKYEEYER